MGNESEYWRYAWSHDKTPNYIRLVLSIESRSLFARSQPAGKLQQMRSGRIPRIAGWARRRGERKGWFGKPDVMNPPRFNLRDPGQPDN